MTDIKFESPKHDVSIRAYFEKLKLEDAARPYWKKLTLHVVDFFRYSFPSRIKDMLLVIKWAWQRVVRGYDDRYMWNHYSEHAEYVLEALRWFRDHKSGYPLVLKDGYCLASDNAEYWKKNNAAWDNILQKMIAGFEALLAFDDVRVMGVDGKLDSDAMHAEYDRLQQVWEEGGALYIKHNRCLWD